MLVDGFKWLLVCFSNYAFLLPGTSRLPCDGPSLYVKPKFQSWISYLLRLILWCISFWIERIARSLKKKVCICITDVETKIYIYGHKIAFCVSIIVSKQKSFGSNPWGIIEVRVKKG